MLGAETISRGVATLRRPAPLPTRLSDQYPHTTRTPLPCQQDGRMGGAAGIMAIPPDPLPCNMSRHHRSLPRITAACPASTAARKCPGSEYHGPAASRAKRCSPDPQAVWWERCRPTPRGLEPRRDPGVRRSRRFAGFAELGNFELCRVLAAHAVGRRSCPALSVPDSTGGESGFGRRCDRELRTGAGSAQ